MPAQALHLQACRFRLGADVVGGAGTMGLAERVATGDQGHGFFIVHGHAAKGFTDVLARGHGVGVTFRAFRVHVDQAHLHGGQRVFQVTLGRQVAILLFTMLGRLGHQVTLPRRLRLDLILAVTGIAAQPDLFRPPVHVFVRLPHIGTPAGEAEGLEAHGFEGNITGEYDQVGPGNLVAVFLLDRPQQAPGLVQADVVRPAVERGEALLARARPSAAITNAVGARAVPGHADEQRAVVAKVGRPPILRVGHQGSQVFLQGLEVEALERLGIVEVRVGAGLGGMLVKNSQVELVRPPVTVGGATTCGLMERAFRFVRHLRVPLGRLSRFPVYASVLSAERVGSYYPSSGVHGACEAVTAGGHGLARRC